MNNKTVIMPRRLTVENGAKALLLGEFTERLEMVCPFCGDLEFADDECDVCDGTGYLYEEVPVSWTTIKKIYEKAVEHFAASPGESGK